MNKSKVGSNKKDSVKIAFTPYQKFVVAILAFLQFTIVLDFMIMSPLGAVLMPALKISPSQFGLVVSAYAFSAGLSGLLAAGFADRFDRKKILIFFYSGFLLATLFCGLAPNYHFLLLARITTGLFGGVVGSIVFAITTDLFALEVRGRVMGFIQSAFAASQVLGLPLGLYFSNLWGWHAPFLMIVAVASIVGLIILFYLKPIDSHLALQEARANPVRHLIATVSRPQYLLAFLMTGLLSVGGFMIMPFSSAFTVHNLGIPYAKLPMIYLITGCFSLFVGPVIGKINDAYGSLKTFIFGSILSAVMVLIYTNLQSTSLAVVIIVNVLLFIGIFSRMIPAQTLTSALPDRGSRGAFMSVSSSLQQIAGGIASVLAGLIISEGPNGSILHFERIGYVIVFTSLVSIGLIFLINRIVKEKMATQTP